MERKNAIRTYYKYFLLLLSFFLLFSSRVNAASDRDYFPMTQAQNGKFNDAIVQKLNSVLDSENNYIFVAYAFDSGQYRYYNYVTVPRTSNNGIPCIYGEKNNDLYHFTLYKNPSNITVSAGQINFDTTNPNRYGNIGYGNTLSYFGNMISSEYSNSTSYMSNFIVYTNNTSTRKMVLFYDDGTYIPDGDTARQDMEKPDADDYFPDWTNKPAFDNTSVENALNSVYSIISWGWDNIKNAITGLGKFISDNVLWGMQKIIDNIRGYFNDLKSALTGWLSDIWDAVVDFGDILSDFAQESQNLFDFIMHPWNSEDFEYTLQHSDFYQIYTSIGDSLDGINDTIDSVNEPESFVIRYSTGFHPDTESGFRMPTIEGEISFDWLIPLRIYYRPILWLVCVYEMVVYGFSTFGDVLQGRTGAK